MKNKFSGALFLVGLLALVAGCGGGGANTTPGKLSGTAATGAPMTGVVTVIGANGVTATAIIGAGGVYSVDTTALTYPVLIKADNGSGKVFFSWSPSVSTTTNITPLTTTALVLTSLPDNLADVFSNWKVNATLLSNPALFNAQKIVNANLESQFTANNLPYQTYDFFNTVFLTNRTGIDGVLDGLNFVFTFDKESCEDDSDKRCSADVLDITIAGNGKPVSFNTNISTAGVTVGNSPLVATSGSVTWREDDSAISQTSPAVFSATTNTMTVNSGSTSFRISLEGSTPGTYLSGSETMTAGSPETGSISFRPYNVISYWPNQANIDKYFISKAATTTITSNANSKISGTFEATYNTTKTYHTAQTTNADSVEFLPNNITVISGVFKDIPVVVQVIASPNNDTGGPYPVGIIASSK